MALGRAKSDFKNSRRLSPVRKNQGERPQGINKKQTLRQSPRLRAIRQSHKQNLFKSNHNQGVQAPLSPPASNIPESKTALPNRHDIYKPSESPRKRKRRKDAGHCSPSNQDQPPPKRLRRKPSSYTVEKELHQDSATDIEDNPEPLQYWIQTGRWRKEYFEQDSQVRQDFERGKSPENTGQKEHNAIAPLRKMHPFTHFLAKKKSSASLRRKQSQSTLQTPSDQPSREAKSSQYNTPDYEIKLKRKGSYMRDYYKIGDNDNKGKNMKDLHKTLLERDQTVPQHSLFRDDLFEKTCEKVSNRNEAIIVQDITRLIVPSAENLAIYGAKHLCHLYETVNEGWTSMAKFEGTLPQPDYSVGFGLSAFTWEQLDKLRPFVGELGSKVTTYFMATTRMYFPFFTCEVKCGAAALDVADRQNAQSMSVALRALIVLFRLVKREKELDQEPLTFSISHDHRSVRIYGHYPVIKGDETTYWRKPIHTFDFTALDGKEKWTAYKFVKNVYDHHSPKLHKLICSAINDLPADINFDLSQSASFPESIPQSSHQSNVEFITSNEEEATSTTSFTQPTEPASKRPKNR